MDRRRRILDFVVPRGRLGLEIGPQTRPVVRREDGAILYADHLSTEGLRAKYGADPNLGAQGVDGLVPIDLVCDGCTLREALGARGPVDYVVASHVIEHVADPIGWLAQCGAVLPEGGLLALAVPDRRFTFDHPRGVTSVGELIEHHLAGASRPRPGQVYEHVARTVPFGGEALLAAWRGEGPDPRPPGAAPAAEALRLARLVAGAPVYLDVHCTTYTPHSFTEVLREVIALDLVPFEAVEIVPTAHHQVEFLAFLRKSSAPPGTRALSLPRLDPARHHALPAPRVRRWRERLRLAAGLLATGRLPGRAED